MPKTIFALALLISQASMGQSTSDTRLGPLRGERDDFNLAVPSTVEAWQARREELRRTMLVTLGLWPMPTKTPLKPVIHGRIDQGDYTIEKVYLESLPGFFLTGNLYRPKNAEAPAQRRSA